MYSAGYNITACGIEKLHPFDSTKYKRIWQFLHQSGIFEDLEGYNFWQPSLPNRHFLLEVMTWPYLMKLNYATFVSSYIELPLCFLPGWFLRSQLLEPMLLGSKGSVDAACIAMKQGWAINLSGGFHHAERSTGGGFCVYPDITFVTHYLRKHFPGVKNILIIDLDAHQGNGHERDHLGDPNTFIIDCYNHRIYPGDELAKQAIYLDLGVSYSEPDDLYLNKIEQAL